MSPETQRVRAYLETLTARSFDIGVPAVDAVFDPVTAERRELLLSDLRVLVATLEEQLSETEYAVRFSARSGGTRYSIAFGLENAQIQADGLRIHARYPDAVVVQRTVTATPWKKIP